MNLVMPIRIRVKAPYTVRGNLVGHFGVDAPLFRTAGGKLAIPGTLVIGKLAEAYRQIAGMLQDADETYAGDLELLFASSSHGEAGDEGDGRQSRRRLTAGDFVLLDDGSASLVRTRIARDAVTQTVSDGMLQVLEQAAAPGEELVFSGELRVTGAAGDDALERRIRKALDWIYQIGGLRTVGFGEVARIKAGDAVASAELGTVPTTEQIGLRLSFRDVFCTGEKRTHANTFTSARIVPGGAIKGALANQILASHGKKGFLGDHADSLPEPFSTLARHYSSIRFRHAFPQQKSEETCSRIGPLPLSLAMAGGKAVDRAATGFPDGPVLIDGVAPSVLSDWKHEERERVEKERGISRPDLDFRMRTQIDEEHRAAMENRLFAIEYCRNDTHDFIGIVDVPKGDDRAAILEALSLALTGGLAGIGRGGAYCDVAFVNRLPEQAAKPGKHVMVLKTPALLRVPVPGEMPDLRAFYQAAFDRIGLADTGFRLRSVFADEYLAGHAFMARRRSRPDYMPYLLTSAGSVFVFEHDDPAATLPEAWFRKGLPVPDIVLKFHDIADEPELWKVCPYVPENGYGEVALHDAPPFKGSVEPVGFIDLEAAS